ncbi:DUF6152 family protein [Ramlibacter sp.]|uniref:DUF6152 family protein n=1 Tax=Ramlibacter sp. TaxID=1917967 RepID=UPI003D0E655A
MTMQRRPFLLAALGLPLAARAHHGWSSFDQDRPIWLEGRVARAKWQNPHVELILEVPADLKLPADLQARQVPAQSAPLDGKALLAKTGLPRRKDRRWEIELAPLTRLEAWKVAEIKAGANVGVLGYTLKDEKGPAVLRVEYLWADGKVYGLRSSPV